MKTKASATGMSMNWLRERGYLVERTEQNMRAPDKAGSVPGQPMKWKMWKKDLWSFSDLAAINPAVNGTTYVQATIGIQHKQERMEKIAQATATRAILASDNTIELHIWRKMGKRGGQKTWQLARFTVRLDGEFLAWEDETGNRVSNPPPIEEKSEATLELF